MVVSNNISVVKYYGHVRDFIREFILTDRNKHSAFYKFNIKSLAFIL